MTGGATFDTSGLYRYHLWRAWGRGERRVAFIMLNPSTADGQRDDPTVRRCLGFARAWGYDALDVVNLFAYRTPRPADVRAAADPVGPDNDRFLLDVTARAGLVVAAWGNHGAWLGRTDAVRHLLADVPLHCLALTGQGQPRHPLYARATLHPHLL